jgi:hypothetical protein
LIAGGKALHMARVVYSLLALQISLVRVTFAKILICLMF